ncbi:hypothetical protein [Streptomyces lavendulae]|uniref:hypothetical protein n=1 Tax=Streptomyces lavendulae TaxID=1914 RepID=UPI0024A57A46|nr:hypothetical protein [Streptomyces lavendulae]GLX23861.1 hypothetical protein Slala01_75050 [Streptomyces lavendulae subsp. lavendulae]GLX31695.1 hypothetical protein Slala02_75140 [Streptomyces lavendulae subsp. lavendulae]
MTPVRRRTAVRLLALALCPLPALAGCGDPAPAAPAGAAVRRAVADWSAAPPARLAGIPLEDWSYRVASVRQDGVRAYARAELRYRLAGYDAAPAASAREVELARDGTGWRVTADRPAPGAPAQLWDQGDPAAVRGAHSLVLGVGRSPQELSALADGADRAVPAVGAAWPGPWARRVVVLAPATLDAMAALLGRPADTYRGLGAVTTGSTGGGPAPADRVVVNPEGYAGLSEAGRRIVLTHEVTHVATRAATSARTPQWLSEGFADWAAYRGTGTTPAEGAPELARAVRRGELPGALPADGDFAFGGDPSAAARAYEGAWLACRLVAARWGEAALVRLYELAGREPLPAALEQALGTDPAGLTAAWQETLRQELR